jgi:RNA polymerase sigma factor (sigma-70 family)
MVGNSGAAGAMPPPEGLSKDTEAKIAEELRVVRPRLLKSIRRLTRDPELAEDLTQEACIAVILEFRKGTVFEQPVIVFATVVARHKFYSHLRRFRTQREHPSDDLEVLGGRPWPYSGDDDSPSASLEYMELLAAVSAAVDHDRQYTVWELTHAWGLRGVEIAAALDISPATVCKDLKKAEAKARKISRG